MSCTLLFNEKETMSSEQTVKLLSVLIKKGSAHNDEFNGLIHVDAETNPQMDQLNDVLRRRQAEAQEKAVEAAADEIIHLQASASDVIESHRRQLSELRRRAAAELQRIEQIAVARLYGNQTMNYLPLARELGHVVLAPGASPISQPDFWVPVTQYDELLKSVKAQRNTKSDVPLKERGGLAVPAKNATKNAKSTSQRRNPPL